MSASETFDIPLDQGATYIMQIQLTEDSGTPLNLTGYLGRGQIRRRANVPELLASFTVTITDPLTGHVQITLPADQTARLPIGGISCTDVKEFPYDIELYTGSPEYVIRPLNGLVQISPRTTRGV